MSLASVVANEDARGSLHLGDCLAVLPTLADGSADMVFCDLPYGVTACKWDSVVDLGLLWPDLLRVAKRHAAFVCTATQPFATTLINSQPNLFRYDLVWDKGVSANIAQASYRVMRSHESIVVFSAAGATYGAKSLMRYNPQMSPRKKPRRPQRRTTTSPTSPLRGDKEDYLHSKVYTEKHPRSVIAISLRADKERGLHPTQKPVALLEWLIRTYTNPGDTVLDPAAGSGTTAIAAIRTGRQYVCIERDPTYFATMQRRVAEETQAAAQQLNFGSAS